MNYAKRFLIIFLILLARVSFAQDTLSLPTPAIRGMFKATKERDQLKFELHKKDSTIRIYEQKDSIHKEEIHQLKLNATEYKEIISNMESLARICEAKLKDKDREVRSVRRRSTLIIVVEAMVIVLLII